jgi:hypothetical protein
MPAELKSEKKTVTTSMLVISIEVTEDNRRPIGLAAHSVLSGFAWDDNDEGHSALRKALGEVKTALNVRAPKAGDKPGKAAATECTTEERPAKAPRKPRKTNGNGEHAPPVGPPKSGTEVEINPPGDGPAVRDPFSVPPGAGG